MRLHHFTLQRTADRIVREGFRDTEPSDVAGSVREGVWFADLPQAEDEGLPEDEWTTLVVDAPDDALDQFEVTGNPMVRSGSHREWCIPASIVNQWPVSRR